MSKEKNENKKKEDEFFQPKADEPLAQNNKKEKPAGENETNELKNKSVNEPVEEDVVKPIKTEKDIYEEKISQLEKDVREYKDAFLRKAADLENYKRRSENDQLNLIRYAAESLIKKLLPVIDDFERSLNHIQNAKDTDAIKEGIKMIYEKLMKVIEEQGVKKIDAVGKPFDVHFHEALMQRPAEGTEPHTVIEELEKGYMYKDRVIRHTKVVVSEEISAETFNKQSEENASEKSNSEDE